MEQVAAVDEAFLHQVGDVPTTSPDTFVLVARGAIATESELDLVDLAPSTIQVRWGADRSVTYLSTGQFLDLWCTERASDADATLGLLRASLVTGDPVPMHVRDPRIVGSGLRWTVTRRDGWLPHESGSCVLVLNPPERPLA
jgi:hypothetical protein